MMLSFAGLVKFYFKARARVLPVFTKAIKQFLGKYGKCDQFNYKTLYQVIKLSAVWKNIETNYKTLMQVIFYFLFFLTI